MYSSYSLNIPYCSMPTPNKWGHTKNCTGQTKKLSVHIRNTSARFGNVQNRVVLLLLPPINLDLFRSCAKHCVCVWHLTTAPIARSFMITSKLYSQTIALLLVQCNIDLIVIVVVVAQVLFPAVCVRVSVIDDAFIKRNNQQWLNSISCIHSMNACDWSRWYNSHVLAINCRQRSKARKQHQQQQQRQRKTCTFNVSFTSMQCNVCNDFDLHHRVKLQTANAHFMQNVSIFIWFFSENHWQPNVDDDNDVDADADDDVVQRLLHDNEESNHLVCPTFIHLASLFLSSLIYMPSAIASDQYKSKMAHKVKVFASDSLLFIRFFFFFLFSICAIHWKVWSFVALNHIHNAIHKD